jgi:hypothetical protein
MKKKALPLSCKGVGNANVHHSEPHAVSVV